MRNKHVPFVSNSLDNMHCVNAVFRMIHQYYFESDLSWNQIDKLTNAAPGKATWTFMGEMVFAQKGLKVTNIEPIDYMKLYSQGIPYLIKIVGKKTSDYYIQKSNITSIIKFIPNYLKFVKHETRRASRTEIINALKQSCLVAAEINASILNNVNGFDLHLILMYDFLNNYFLVHDPGLPPFQERKVSLNEFEKCFNYPGANGAITIFRE